MTESMRRARRRVITCAIWLGIVVPAPVFADALGDARLFFTRTERDRVSPDRAGHESAGTHASGRAPAERNGSSRQVVAKGREVDAPRAGTRRRIGFDALLQVNGHVRIIVGGGPCRHDVTGTVLQCDRAPDGIESLALAPDGRRLVVTFEGGRRVRVGVGEAIVP